MPREFYFRGPDEVAAELLGKLLVRIYKGRRLSGFIVETEAYFGPEDPASRAKRGGGLAKVMEGEVGLALVYGVHRKWLLNVVAHEEGGIGAVLIRAIHPFEGVELMKELRKVRKIRELTNGPGKLTEALAVDKKFHRKPLYLPDSDLRIERGSYPGALKVARSHRIGVSEDLPVPYRFYVEGDPYVSKVRPL
ncbi:MAG: 3-methyladenine DNA glycosylase [Thermofilum sp. ex4484_15]|nr:MAG: 3-methyladenine DNA glycosylase [Thermofilum sp. ex4484_15]